MAASVLAILALPLPPLSILSAAVVGLITLRKGMQEGGLTLALSGVACAILALLLFSHALTVIGYVLLMWVPVWLLGGLLRSYPALGLALAAALLMGVVTILGQYLQAQDPAEAWRSVLKPFIDSLVESQLVQPDISDQLLTVMSTWMPGAIAAGFVLQAMAALFLARWWQALLYNPGGFAAEFHQLRLPRAVAVVTLIVGAFVWLVPDARLATYLATLLLAGWGIQGIALAHGLRSRLGASTLWLVVMYALLFFAMPYVTGFLAFAGFTDAWIDFRARLRTSGKSGESG
jgi:hypothetical protein